jgi:Uma2 family endonuclease
MVATVAPTTLMTAEEFSVWAELPENAGTRYELENGVPVEMPNPTLWHGHVCWFVILILSGYVLPRRGRVATNDSGLIVRRRPDTVRGPDVMIFLDQPPEDEVPRGPATDRPALVVEVLSPSDRPGKTRRRVAGYLKRGIPMVWVIDPEDRTVDVHCLGVDAVLLELTDELVGDPQLPGFRCPVSAFFSWPTVPPPPAA